LMTVRREEIQARSNTPKIRYHYYPYASLSKCHWIHTLMTAMRLMVANNKNKNQSR